MLQLSKVTEMSEQIRVSAYLSCDPTIKDILNAIDEVANGFLTWFQQRLFLTCNHGVDLIFDVTDVGC